MAQRHALHAERTAKKAFMLSGRVQLSSAEARVVGIVGGAVGGGEGIPAVFFMLSDTHRTHVSLHESHGIPQLRYKSSNHGYPTRYKVRGIAWGCEMKFFRRQR